MGQERRRPAFAGAERGVGPDGSSPQQ
jgi:hypothetical protein